MTDEPSRLPPRLTAPARSGSVGIFVALIALLAVVVTLFLFNPAEHAFYPQCYFHLLTGWQCPGCGGLRAMHRLLHGDVLAALQFNALAVIALPGCGWLLFQEFRARRQGRAHRFLTPRWVWIGLALLLVFSVLRNLPAFAFLSP